MTAFVLKIIALTCMLIDHVGAVFPDETPTVLRVIGRVSLPLYVYLIAEGCRHTRDMRKYLLRLFLFALISQIPYSLAFSHLHFGETLISFVRATNVFYTLFLGVSVNYVYRLLRKTGNRWLPLLILPVLIGGMGLAELLTTDYAGNGVFFVFLVYLMPKKWLRVCALTFCCFVLYGMPLWFELWDFAMSMINDRPYMPYFSDYGMALLFASLTAAVLAALYNGRRGPGLKWFFYIAYPAHILLLGVARLILIYGGWLAA